MNDGNMGMKRGLQCRAAEARGGPSHVGVSSTGDPAFTVKCEVSNTRHPGLLVTCGGHLVFMVRCRVSNPQDAALAFGCGVSNN